MPAPSLFSQIEVQVILIDEILLKVILNVRKNINHGLGLVLFGVMVMPSREQVQSVGLDPVVSDRKERLVTFPRVVEERRDV